MQRNFLRFVRVACLSVIALVLLGGGIADAVKDLNKELNGDYAVTAFRSCMQSAAGFDANDALLASDGSPRTTAIRGTLTFNGDGTGSGASLAQLIISRATGAGSFPVATSTSTSTFTYTVNADGSFTLQIISSTGNIDTGLFAGETFILTGGVRQGQIAESGRTLLLFDTEPDVETLVVTNVGTFKRICGRSGIAVKLK